MLPFLAGLAAGLILSAPVGPMGALAAYHSSQGQARAAWTLAIGVCAADSLLALLATLGTNLPLPHNVLTTGVALLMLGMAWHLWHTARRNTEPNHTLANAGVGFGATLLHPANLLAFGITFSWLNTKGLVVDSMTIRLILAGGVFIGAIAMWAGLISVTRRLGQTLAMQRFQVRFKYVLSALCGMTGLWALSSLL